MNRKFSKKFGGLLLSLVMLVSMLPMTALAAPPVDTPSAAIGDSSIDLVIGQRYGGEEMLTIQLSNMKNLSNLGSSITPAQGTVAPAGVTIILSVTSVDTLGIMILGTPTTELTNEPIEIYLPVGYFNDSNGGSITDVIPVTVNPNAVWNIKKAVYNVTVTAENGTAAATPEEAFEGDEVTLTATPNEGYKFKEWLSNEVTVENDKFIMPANDVTVNAIFEKEEFTVTITSDGNGTVDASPQKARMGDEVILSATPNEGYTFKEWQSDDITITGGRFIMPAKNVTLKAIFTVLAQPTEAPTAAPTEEPTPTEEPVVTPTPEVPNDTPKTGDNENILFVALLLITISAAGILILKKRSSNK